MNWSRVSCMPSSTCTPAVPGSRDSQITMMWVMLEAQMQTSPLLSHCCRAYLCRLSPCNVCRSLTASMTELCGACMLENVGKSCQCQRQPGQHHRVCRRA